MYKILVVEDDKIIHESIYNFLVEDNYAVYSAYDGEEALAIR